VQSSHLARLDLNDWATNHYRVNVFAQLGVYPAHDVTDASALQAALVPDGRGGPSYRWRGTVRDIRSIDETTYVRFETGSGVPVAIRWRSGDDAELVGLEWLASGVVGQRVHAVGRLVPHDPDHGAIAIVVQGRFSCGIG
jgi:hypothetical protein